MRNPSLIQKYRLSATVALSAILLTSCGASTYKETASGTTQAQSTYTGGTPPTGGTTAPTGSTGGGDTSTYPAITTSFTLTGSSGSTPSYSYTVTTDNLLKVRVNAGAATNVIPGSNFSATYECVSYNVTALGQTLSTGTLSVSGGNSICPGAPTSKTLDFSSRLTAGHQSVTVKVVATGYDFYCQSCLTYPWMFNAYPYGYYSCSMYCPLKTVYQNHGVTGTMDIQVNGTSL
ncbi:MAG: hypothetical protein ACJ763_02005 [Bdellovibrionia bacterium]